MTIEMEQMKEMLSAVEARLDAIGQEIEALRGLPCQRCSRKDGDKIIGPLGDVTQLVGGYEAILCRACRNAWTVAVDESGLWLASCQAEARLDLAERSQSNRHDLQSIVELDFKRMDDLVAAAYAAERKLFQFAVKWVAGGTPAPTEITP